MTTMTMTQANGMTAAAEVWAVDADGGAARRIEGVYGSCEALRLTSDGLRLEAGQGLVGAVAAREVPILLDELDDESFERCEAARASGVDGALALPLFDEGRLTHVAVLMFRGAAGMVGAVELWTGRRGRFELGLAEAFAPGLDRFAALSQHVNFPMGSGLPGLVWQSSRPMLLKGIGTSVKFLRSTGAETAGLTTGIGYPVRKGNELQAVALWLSSAVSPLLKRHEVWLSETGDAAGLQLADVADEAGSLERADGLKGYAERAAQERRPVVFDVSDAQAFRGANEIVAGVALPVLVHDRVTAVGVIAW
ncbi:MAG: hypothetical protein AAGB29_08745 [Planctomycetota bacterium]